MKLAFEPIWPWPLVLLACIAMLAVVAIGYPRRIRHLSVLWRRIFAALRIALVLLLTLWLTRPLLILESDDSSEAVLYVVLDASGSMETPDGIGGTTRRAAMLQLLADAKPYLDDLADSVEVRFRELSEGLVAVEEPLPTADGKMTAIGANLEVLAKEAAREKIAAILFWSDGKQAASGKLDVDAVQAAKLLGRQHRPIYSVPFGSSEVAATTLDVSVSELDVARDAFVRNVVPVKVRFRALGAAGRDVRVRVLVEQRGELLNGQSGPMRQIVPDRDNVTVRVITPVDQTEDMTVELQFVPQETGEIKIAVEAEPLDDEVQRTNNRVEGIIRVRDGGIRVAYFDALRFESRFLSKITVSSRVQLDSQTVWQGAFANRNEFDESWFEPGRYDAFIIGDVPAQYFGTERLTKIAVCCEQGAGLMMIGGQNNYGRGGYQRSPLARFLPVQMTDGDQHLDQDVAMIPRRAAITNPILQIAPPDQNSRRWSELPPLQGANLLRVQPGTTAQILAETKTNSALLIGQSIGATRVLAFAGDTTWQWAMDSDRTAEAHQRFWRQVIFWLTKMENDGDARLWVNVEPRSLNPGRIAELSFGLRDSDGLPLSKVQYSVNVQRPDGESEDVAPRAVDAHGAGDYQNTVTPGDYWVNVSTQGGEGDGMLYASTRFLVNARDPELDNPAADPALMRELAHVSGGDFLTPEAMLERLEQWTNDGLPSLAMKRSERLTL